jgi:hypothetical protein
MRALRRLWINIRIDFLARVGHFAQSAACAGVELPNLATSRHVGTSRLRSKTSRGRASRNDDVLVLSFQTSRPACFSTSLEDLAGSSVALVEHPRAQRPHSL